MLPAFFSCSEPTVTEQFREINTSLEKTKEQFQSKTEAAYLKIDSLYSDDAQRYAQLHANAASLKQMTGTLITYIDELKKLLITEGAHVEGNYDVTTRIMIDQGKGADLRNRVSRYKKTVLKLVAGKPGHAEAMKNLELEDVDDGSGLILKWEEANFFHLPIAAAVTNLSKIQSDIKNFEADVLKALINDNPQ